MKLFILLLLCQVTFGTNRKTKYCNVIAERNLYPEVNIVQFCNSYVRVVGLDYCCVKETNQDDILPYTCLPIASFLSRSDHVSATLRPQTFRTKAPYVTTIPTTTVRMTSTLSISSFKMQQETTPFPITRSPSRPEYSTTKLVTATSSTESSQNMQSTPQVDDDQILTFGINKEETTMFQNIESFDGEEMFSNSKSSSSQLNSADLEISEKWVERFQRSLEQASTPELNNIEIYTVLFREALETFIIEYKQTQCIVHPTNDLLVSEPSTFTKTPFDFTLYNIWNALFVENEWNSKFTFPNFVIDQQTGILVTTLATLVIAFCDKQTRDRMAFVADEISQMSCCEQFCCPTLFYLIKLILRRAKYPPPRKSLKKKLKHLPKKSKFESNKQPTKPGKNSTKNNNKLKNKQKRNVPKKTQPNNERVLFKNKSNPEISIEIDDILPHPTQTFNNSELPRRNRNHSSNGFVNQHTFEVSAMVHNCSDTYLSIDSNN